MKSRIVYVELKSDFADRGPAWIGRANFSKSGSTVYFNGNAYRVGQGVSGNYYEIETGDEYWISGVKKNGLDRHWAGGGIIDVDESVVEEYLNFVGWRELPSRDYRIVELDNTIPKQKVYDMENEKLD